MKNLRSLMVKRLQAKCKAMGISSSGNKNQLSERIESSNEMESQKSSKLSSHNMQQCIPALESQLANR